MHGSTRDYARPDDVSRRHRVDGVEPERAEDVPRAHLPAVFVLRWGGWLDESLWEIQLRTYPVQTIDGAVVVGLRDLADALLGLGRRAGEGV